MADEKPPLQQIATAARDPWLPQFQETLDPADETLRAKGGGKGLALYDEIRRDGHAFGVLQKRKLEVTAREWIVLPASERLKDRKAAELVEQQLKALDFDRLTKGLMGAVLKGYAVAEVLWENRGGTWWAAAAKVKKQRRFRFTPEGELRLVTREALMHGVPVPDRKFVVHRHNIDDEDDEPYGLGLGSVLFWPAWMKRQVLAHWLQTSERFAAPTVLAVYPGGYDKQKQDELLGAIRMMARDAGIVVPDGVLVSLLQATGNMGQTQEGLARFLDEMMSEAVLGETLSTNAGERGARSLGEVHDGVRKIIAKADADAVSASLNTSLVKWIVEINMPGAGLPTVWRDFADQENLNDRVDRDQKLVSMGYRPKSVDYINETYGGEWIEQAEAAAEDDEDAPDPPAPAFADPVEEDPLASLVDRADEEARPAIEAMIRQIIETVQVSTSYEDLAQRLLSLYPALDPSGVADAMERALIISEAAGRAEVQDGR